jgi:hypothetical protein
MGSSRQPATAAQVEERRRLADSLRAGLAAAGIDADG